MDITVLNREAWLTAGIEVFRPMFVQIGFPLPDKIRVSIGWGTSGARQENAQILGVTMARSCSADGVNEIYISPEDADTANMLETLLHELIHVADNCEHGHRGPFAEMATRLGFLGPMTTTPPSVDLRAELFVIAAELGEYPGAQITIPSRVLSTPIPVGPNGKPVRWSSGPGTQTTRMIKVACPHTECEGYFVRTTQKWITVGLPRCPRGHRMEVA